MISEVMMPIGRSRLGRLASSAMVETASKNYLQIALEEISAGKIKYRYR